MKSTTKIKLKRLLVIIYIMVVSVFPTEAEDTTEFRPSYILFGNYHQNYHKASFSQLPGVNSCCPQYESGEGPGFSVGVNYQFPLPFKLSVGLGLGYYDFSGDLTAYETKPVRIGNSIQDARIMHSLETSVSDIGFTPYISYNIAGGLNLTFGGHIGMIVNGSFRQYETLVEPEGDAVFGDTGSRTRNDTSGKIPSLETVYSSLFAGISYDIRLHPESIWIISPTLSYNWGRSDIVNNLDWIIDALMVGFQLKYSPPVEKIVMEEEFKRIFKIDTLTFLSEDYKLNTVVKGVQNITTEQSEKFGKIINTETVIRTDTLFKRPIPRLNVDINVPVINLEGQFVTQAFPLVPVVFFEKNSSGISQMYYRINNSQVFLIEDIRINSVEYQRHILNIIGSRMKETPEGTLYITGYCDSVSEGDNIALATARAESVASYLKSVWEVPEIRIKINKSGSIFPPQPTITQNDSGYADNRRIELSTENPSLLAPIKNKKYVEPKAINPPVLTFDPNGSTSKGIKSWSLKIKKGNAVLTEKNGEGYPGLLFDTLRTHNFEELFNSEPVTIELAMTDFEGQTGVINKEIPVKADTSEYELQRLSLILFEVGSELLIDNSKRDIRTFLSDVNPESIIRIKGFTDPLGSEMLNKSLSEARAKNTAAFIKAGFPKLNVEQAKGVAFDEFPPGLDSYQTPIERFLSRTVFIEVLNKIK